MGLGNSVLGMPTVVILPGERLILLEWWLAGEKDKGNWWSF